MLADDMQLCFFGRWISGQLYTGIHAGTDANVTLAIAAVCHPTAQCTCSSSSLLFPAAFSASSNVGTGKLDNQLSVITAFAAVSADCFTEWRRLIKASAATDDDWQNLSYKSFQLKGSVQEADMSIFLVFAPIAYLYFMHADLSCK